MAENAQLEVTIEPDGTVTIRTRGLQGEACIEETKGLEKALGTVRAREKTPEYYARNNQAQNKIRGR